MAKSLSDDLRSRLIAAVDGGMSRRAAAERFGVAAASAVRWVQAWRTTGAARAKPQGGDKRSHRIEAYRDVILAAIEAQVDITLVELAEMLRREHDASFAPSTVWRCLDRHAMTVKKAAHASEQERPDVAARRKAWFNAQPVPVYASMTVLAQENGVLVVIALLRTQAVLSSWTVVAGTRDVRDVADDNDGIVVRRLGKQFDATIGQGAMASGSTPQHFQSPPAVAPDRSLNSFSTPVARSRPAHGSCS